LVCSERKVLLAGKQSEYIRSKDDISIETTSFEEVAYREKWTSYFIIMWDSERACKMS
jgi:hypothetical protein